MSKFFSQPKLNWKLEHNLYYVILSSFHIRQHINKQEKNCNVKKGNIKIRQNWRMYESWQNYPNQNLTHHINIQMIVHIWLSWIGQIQILLELDLKTLRKLVCCILMFRRHYPIILIEARYKKFSSQKVWQPI
jgi:hypothetical protein